ncbi:protein kinase domain-containing protein [Nocardia sp. NPDC004415]
MSVSREFVLDLTRRAARDLGMRTYWTSGILLLALVQACRRDALSLPAADRHDARRGALAEELGELRDMVWRAGIDPDRAAETAAATWRADHSAPCHEDEPRLRPHTQATLVLGRMHERAAADPRATAGYGAPDPRAVHLFLGLLDHPDGAVGTFLRELGTDVVAAREAAAVPGDEWALGEVVDERYEVTAIITAGGMGVVYRVHHRDWGVDLAVKAPRAEHFADPSVLPMFEAEARAWLELGEHPNVVACRYVSRYRGLPRVLAEWVPGGSLADAIEDRALYAQGSATALARILDIAIQSAWGLDHVHRCGLVHQDVKPGNILLAPEPDGRTLAKITDIGLARAWTVGAPRQVEALRRAVDLAGTVAAGYAGYTPAFCSPEQHAWSTGTRQLLDRATDVWSWAATVLAMFHGHRPSMLGTEAPRLLDQLVDGTGPAPRPAPDVPPLAPEIAEVLAQCLRPYAYRPHDMNAVADRLIAAHRRLFGADYPRGRPAAPARRPVEAVVNEALSWLELGELGTARALLSAAVEQDPTHPYAVYHRLRLDWRTGAITDLEMRAGVLDAQRSDPLDPVYELFLGAVALERCDGGGSRRHLDLLPWQLPHDPMAQRLLTTAHHRQVHGTASTERFGAPIGRLDADGGVHLLADAPATPPRSAADPASPIVATGTDGALAVVGTATGAVFLAEVSTGRVLRTLVTGGPPVTHAVLADRDTKVVVATQDGTVRTFYVSRRVEAPLLLPPPGWRHRQRAVRAAVDLTRQLFAAGKLPEARACLRAADQLPTAQRHPALVRLRREVLGHRRGEFRTLWPRPLGIRSCERIRLAADGTRVAVLAPRDFDGVTTPGWWWIDTITRETTPADGPPAVPAALLPDGSRLEVDPNGQLIRTTVDGRSHPAGVEGVDRVQVSADGRTALLTGRDGSQRVWYPDQERTGAALPPGPVAAAALAADGTFALVYRSGLTLFDLSTGELSDDTYRSLTGLAEIQLSADGRTAITREPTAVTVWELLWD